MAVLIEFSVKNFKSISEKVTFSAVASSSSAKNSKISFETGSAVAPNLLNTAVILGPNASGKSSIIEAFDFFLDFLGNSSVAPLEKNLNFEQNVIADGYADIDSEFELIFSDGDSIYQYGYSLNKTMVTKEWLYTRSHKSRSRERVLIERRRDPKAAKINEEILGQKEVWKKSTKKNALLFSTAVQLNSKFLTKLGNWIGNNIYVQTSGAFGPSFTCNYITSEKTYRRNEFNKFINRLDLHMEGFSVRELEMVLPDSTKRMFTEEALQEFFSDTMKHWKIAGRHKRADGEIVELDFEKESDGTKRLFFVAGPILDVLEGGYTLIVDELNSSLHPCALKGIIEMFHDKEINKKNAQLVFTTHEVSIIDDDTFHKDQIWFVQRPDGLLTELTPLSDYEIRDLRTFKKSYLNGKFGAIPMTSSF